MPKNQLKQTFWNQHIKYTESCTGAEQEFLLCNIPGQCTSGNLPDPVSSEGREVTSEQSGLRDWDSSIIMSPQEK